MIRFFMLFSTAVLLAGCGVASSSDQESGLNSAVVLTALQAVGATVAPIPDTGCSGSAIPPEKIVELINAFPEEQRGPLAQVLSVSSTAWATQLYNGDLGVGLCFPVEQLVVVMPPGMVSSSAAAAYSYVNPAY